MASLPHGDQRKLEVALLMALESQVFMFDEPTAGMNAAEAPVILNLIRKLKEDTSKTILLVEHKMDVVRELADRIIVLHNGTLVADGEPADVIASPIVQEAYLGWRPGRFRAGWDAPIPTFPLEGEGAKAMNENLLTLQGVHTHIGAYHILHGVDLAVPRGKLTMLLGRNGAGKTTTLRTIMGLWHASQGRITFNGQDITQLRHAADRLHERGLRAREHGHLRRPHRQGEHAAGRARRQERRRRWTSERLQVDLLAVPGGGEVLEPPGRQAVGRAEADAGRRRAPSSSRANC